LAASAGAPRVQSASIRSQPDVPEQTLDSRARQALALFEGIDDAVFVHDMEGRILDVNPAACRRLGYSREELLRLTTRDIDAPEFAGGFQRRLQDELANGRGSFEGCHVTRDGRLIPVDVNASVIHINGQPMVLAVMRDLTRRKTRERRLDAQYTVTRVLAEAGTVADATGPVLQAICNGMGWEVGSIWTVDPSTGILRCVDFRKPPELALPGFETLTWRINITEGLGFPGQVWGEGKPIWLEDIRPDSDFLRAVSAIKEGLRSAFGFPIRDGSKAIGVVELFSRQRLVPDDHFLSMTTSMGSQICQFIERKRAEEERDRFFRLSLDLICIAGFDGFFKRLNPAWERILGFSIEELMAQPYLNFVHPEDRPKAQKEVEKLGTGVNTFAFESRSLCKDGSYRWILWNATPLPEQGLIYAAGHDITVRKRAEDEIKSFSSFLHSIVENIPTMLFVKDADQLRFERVNKAAEQLLGMPREALLGKNDYDFFPPDQADFFCEKDREVLASKKLAEITEEIKTASGRKFLFTRKIPILDDKEDAKYLLGISEDITERKALEETRRRLAEDRERAAQELQAKNQALIESERRYRQLSDASLDGIVVADQWGRILLINPAAEKTFGYPATEAIGKSLTLLMPEDSGPLHQAGLRRFVETRQGRLVGRTIELQGRRKDGSNFPMELSLSAIDLGGEVQFLGSIRDLTERNRLRSRMFQTEKLASIGLLSAGVAHEINNPLAYVANNLVVLERDTKGLMQLLDIYHQAHDRLAQVAPGTARRAYELAESLDLPYVRDNLDRILTRTREGVQRVAKIVQSLRGLARTDRPQLEMVQLPELVESSLEMIRGRLQRRGIKVEMDFGDTTQMRCVPTQLGQVLLNLLVNALQAIEAANRQEEGLIRLTARTVNDEILIEITDNGCGIDPQDLPRLFDPFFTTKPVGEGTGLGLSITHGIITGHGGRIEVDSQPGQGSTFRLFIPQDPNRGSP
jgi:PAS domain S-box-containing protein